MEVLLLLSEEAMRIQEDRPRRMMKDEWMYYCIVWMIVKNNKYQKEWHNATKPLKKKKKKKKDGCHKQSPVPPSSPYLFLWRPKNNSKIKRRRRPNPRVASLYSMLFAIQPYNLSCTLSGNLVTSKGRWFASQLYSTAIAWMRSSLVVDEIYINEI
jgi:hypothetical protein